LLFPFLLFVSPSLAADAAPAARWEKHIRKFEEADRNEPPQQTPESLGDSYVPHKFLPFCAGVDS
jgi:hypothetical protein